MSGLQPDRRYRQSGNVCSNSKSYIHTCTNASSSPNNLVVHQMDVKTAYLHAPIHEDIYIEQPEGFEAKSDTGGKTSVQVKKIPLWLETIWKELV